MYRHKTSFFRAHEQHQTSSLSPVVEYKPQTCLFLAALDSSCPDRTIVRDQSAYSNQTKVTHGSLPVIGKFLSFPRITSMIPSILLSSIEALTGKITQLVPNFPPWAIIVLLILAPHALKQHFLERGDDSKEHVVYV